MVIARTLSLHVMRETLVYCAITFAVLTLVLLTQNLLRRLDELFLVGMTGADIGVVIESIVPIALSYAIPLAFLVGILLVIRRMGRDGEILALQASGIGPIRLLVPFLVLSLPVAAFSGWIVNDVEHRARRELVSLFKRVAARGAILEPGKFRHIGQHLVFVEDRGRNGSLSGVMIYDQSRGQRAYRIFASRGQFHFDETTSEIQLDLEEGGLHFDPAGGDPRRYERVEFESFSYRLAVGHLLGMDFGPVRPKQMTVTELRSVLARARSGDSLRELDQRDPIEYALEIQRRRALPFAPILFAYMGVPISLAFPNRGRSFGFFLVLIAAFGYFALGQVSATLAGAGFLGPGLAGWVANIVYAAGASFLVWSGRDRIAS